MRMHHPVVVVIAFPLIATACNRRLPPTEAGSIAEAPSAYGIGAAPLAISR